MCFKNLSLLLWGCKRMFSFIMNGNAQTGWRTYRRPDEKSGGHGVGWSPIIPYKFAVPEGWEEVCNLLSLARSLTLLSIL